MVLVERPVDAHDDAADALALGRERIENEPAVLHAQHACDLRDAGLDVDLDLRELHAARAARGEPGLPFAVDRDRLGAEQAARGLPVEALRRSAFDEMRPSRATRSAG